MADVYWPSVLGHRSSTLGPAGGQESKLKSFEPPSSATRRSGGGTHSAAHAGRQSDASTGGGSGMSSRSGPTDRAGLSRVELDVAGGDRPFGAIVLPGRDEVQVAVERRIFERSDGDFPVGTVEQQRNARRAGSSGRDGRCRSDGRRPSGPPSGSGPESCREHPDHQRGAGDRPPGSSPGSSRVPGLRQGATRALPGTVSSWISPPAVRVTQRSMSSLIGSTARPRGRP